MPGTLYLCATPIGNLGDMTPRAVETLKAVDVIAAEDTRNSIRLLNHFDIHTPMTSYHEHNKVEKGRRLIQQMREGKDIALITDAGTPAISDPGEALVQMCRENGLPVTALPGPSACITALSLSGLPARRFCFEGFLPAEKKQRRQALEELARESRTMILYEAPHRLTRTLRELRETLGDRDVTVCRELTKKFETVTATTLKKALEQYAEQQPKGEYVLVIRGRSLAEKRQEEISAWTDRTVEEHMAYYTGQGMDGKEAMKRVARDRGVGKREIYACLYGNQNVEPKGESGGRDDE